MDQFSRSDRRSRLIAEATRRLQLAVDRSPRLRILLLAVVHSGGYLLTLAPLLLLCAAAGMVLYLDSNIRGPLDWFMIEVCVAIGLVAAYACYQLYTMKPAPTSGLPLQASSEPELFAMLERRLAHFKSGRIDDVRLTNDAGIKVVATPRAIIPLLHRYTLCLGVPLAFFVNEGQFRVALAGAISAGANARRFPVGWLLRTSQDWHVVIATLNEHPNLISRMLLPALLWIEARCTALSRDSGSGTLHEQIRWILENTDESFTRDLLSKQILAGAFLDRHYWPMVLKAAELCPEPVVRPFRHFDLLLRKTFTEDTARRWLLQAQAGSSGAIKDLRDVLAETGIDYLDAPTLVENNAFDSIFRKPDTLKQMDQYWQQQIKPEWARRHHEYQTEKKRFEQLKQRSELQDLRGDSAINYVRLANRFLEKHDTINVFRRIYRANTDDATVCFVCGEAMLGSGHALEGCDALQRASELDGKLANRAHALISQNKQSWLNRKADSRELALIA